MCKFVASLGGFQIAMAKANDAFEKAVFVGASGVIMAFTTTLQSKAATTEFEISSRKKKRFVVESSGNHSVVFWSNLRKYLMDQQQRCRGSIVVITF